MPILSRQWLNLNILPHSRLPHRLSICRRWAMERCLERYTDEIANSVDDSTVKGVYMSKLIHSDVYWKLAGQCAQCGHCKEACPSLSAAGLTLGETAKALIAAQNASETQEDLMVNIYMNQQLVQAVRGCFFCTKCQQTCFGHNDVANLMYSARVDFQNLGLIPRAAWSSVMVDQEWDIFTAYRAVHGIGFRDLTRHIATEITPEQTDCKIAFFPGCSLAAYGPELTREIFDTIEQLGGKTTMLDHCCGSPLKSAGFFERAEALCDRIADEVATSGAGEIVCVCPGCANAMRSTLAKRDMDVNVCVLPEFLNAHGFEAKNKLPEDAMLRLSKSCQDRTGTCLEATRKALGVTEEQSPAIYGGCCGAGGAVSAFDAAQAGAQTEFKLEQVAEGETLVTMCPTCTYTYAFKLMEKPRDIQNKHYTELLFENQLDWETVSAQLNGMWYGEYGPWLAQVFA